MKKKVLGKKCLNKMSRTLRIRHLQSVIDASPYSGVPVQTAHCQVVVLYLTYGLFYSGCKIKKISALRYFLGNVFRQSFHKNQIPYYEHRDPPYPFTFTYYKVVEWLCDSYVHVCKGKNSMLTFIIFSAKYSHTCVSFSMVMLYMLCDSGVWIS